jgi:4-amino-4-deoxy-L-arabinose transferase-like glycosyltransferase
VTPRVFRAVLLVLGIALALRIAFFSGLVGSDDLVYARAASDLLRGHVQLPPTHQTARVGLIGMIALAFAPLGVSEIALVLPTIAASLLQIALAFLLLHRMGRAGEGLVAAAILAVLPGDVLAATQVYPDGPAAAALAAFVVLSWPRPDRRRGTSALSAIGAGLCLGLAYLIKETSLVALVVWGPAMLLAARFGQGFSRRALVLVVLAAAAVGIAEATFYGVACGDPLARLHALAGHNESSWSGAVLYGGHLARRVFVDAPVALLLDPAYLLLFSAALLLARTAWRSERRLRPVLAWLVFLLLFFAAGTTSPTAYAPLPLVRRFWLAMTFPAAVVVAVGVVHVARGLFTPGGRRRAAIRLAAWTALVAGATTYQPGPFAWIAVAAFGAAAAFLALSRERAAAVAFLGGTAAFILAGLLGVYPQRFETARLERELYRRVATAPGTVYTDPRTREILDFFDGYRRPERFRTLAETGPGKAGGLIAVNEPRISFHMENYGYAPPAWMRSGMPPGMPLIATIGPGAGRNIYLFAPGGPFR